MTYRIEFYEDGRGSQPVLRWLREELPAAQRRAIGVAMREVLEEMGVGVCETEFGRQLGGGLFEFRLRQDAEEVLRRVGKEPRRAEPTGERILLRVFCHAHGDQVILLLGGYDKGRDPKDRRQQREIDTARERLADLRRRPA